MQQIEPKTFSKFCARVSGTDAYSHFFDSNAISVPKELPYMFKNWKEYRDYLLENLVKPEYWELFKNRWKKQNDEDFYKLHVREILINDIDGTINKNYISAKTFKEHILKKEGKRK